uniref:Uncharacterized protein n=1 Tax=Vitis vinifera TaxID=29760 RepID=F6H016_VITVI
MGSMVMLDNKRDFLQDEAVPNHLRRPHHTRLPRPFSVPVSRVKKWLPQIPPILVLVLETHP